MRKQPQQDLKTETKKNYQFNQHILNLKAIFELTSKSLKVILGTRTKIRIFHIFFYSLPILQ